MRYKNPFINRAARQIHRQINRYLHGLLDQLPEGTRLSFEVVPPDYECGDGSFRVTATNLGRICTGHAVGLGDAFYMAKAKLEQTLEPETIKAVTLDVSSIVIETPVIEGPKTSGADIII